jgi:hypothetical protein
MHLNTFYKSLKINRATMPHITFIHGIANKPPEEKLLRIWTGALADDRLGNDDAINLGTLGITSSMIYWADVLYEKPAKEGTNESIESLESTSEAVQKEKEPDMSWVNGLKGKEKDIILSLADKLLVSNVVGMSAEIINPMREQLERIPLPWPVKKLLMKLLLKDVHHYLFNKKFSPRPGTTYHVQDEIRKRVLQKLQEINTDLHIVVSHSMGTIIMYDCLQRVPGCTAINALMTVGSPLGIDEVQDCLKPEWSRENGYPPKIKGDWVNVFDTLDPVTGLDGNISNDFKKGGKKIIQVINEQNEGAWRHDITKYLYRPKLRKALRKMLHL